MKKISGFIFLLVLLSSSITIGQQAPCDINNNGLSCEIADMISMVNMLGGHSWIDSLPNYWINGDCDQDSLDVTLSDSWAMARCADYHQGVHFESSTDTILVPDASAFPGQEILLPVYVQTARLLNGFQFYLIYDSNSINISEVVQPDSLPTRNFNWGGYLFEGGVSVVDMYSNPNEHDLPVAYLRININPNFPSPGETHITFGNDRSRILYTGLSEVDSLAVPPDPNVMFISPVMIGSTITILPTGIGENRNTNDDRISLEIYGNPANVTYLIRYYVPKNSHVDLGVYDLLGRQVAILVNENLLQGHHEISWNAGDKASGIYFCRLSTDHDAVTKKITLIK